MSKKKYKPFGEEWEKEMMKWSKKQLIDYIRSIANERDILKQQNKIAGKREGIF
jgi:hypothetical protein